MHQHRMGREMNHTHENEKNAIWKAGREHLERIAEEGGFERAISYEPDAFPEKTRCVCCMDERVVDLKKDGVFVAGSGLLAKDDKSKRAAFIAGLKKAGVKDTSTHEHCGAVAEYARQKGISREEAEEEARAWARELAAELGGSYEGEHTVSPEDYHVAQVLYYDLTGRFNPGTFPVFPPGFVVSRKYVSEGDALEQAKFGIGIALGEHGYGNRFDAKHPFMLVVVADTKADLARGKKEVKKLIGSAVALDGFVREDVD